MKINKKIAVSESGFVFDSSTGDSFSVNPSGIEIINLVRENKAEDDIRKILLDKYEVSVPVLEKSLSEFLGSLRIAKIIED
jgi:hypothetical protein